MLLQKLRVTRWNMLVILLGLVIGLSACSNTDKAVPEGGHTEALSDIQASDISEEAREQITIVLEQMLEAEIQDDSTVNLANASQAGGMCQETVIESDYSVSGSMTGYKLRLYNYNTFRGIAKDILGLGDGQYTFVQELNEGSVGDVLALFQYNPNSFFFPVRLIASTRNVTAGDVNRLQITHDFANDDKVFVAYYGYSRGSNDLAPLKVGIDSCDSDDPTDPTDPTDPIIPEPVVTGIVPQYPQVSGSEWITVVGEDFKEGATVVLYGPSNVRFSPRENASDYNYVNANQIRIRPDFTDMADYGAVIYNSPTVSSEGNAFAFSVVDTPQITSVSPNPVRVTDGTNATITISGDNLFNKTSIAFYPSNSTEGEAFFISPNNAQSNGYSYTYNDNGTITLALDFKVNEQLRTGEWGLQAHSPHYRKDNCDAVLGADDAECVKARQAQYSSLFAGTVPLVVQESNGGIGPVGNGDDYPFTDPNKYIYYPYCDGEKAGDDWKFCVKHCTSFVAHRLHQMGIDMDNHNYLATRETRWGNAANWDTKAESVDLTVDNNPSVGAIAQWEPDVSGAKDAGHVAYVREVHGDGTITIEEYNFTTPGGYGTRRISVSSVSNFIHFQ